MYINEVAYTVGSGLTEDLTPVGTRVSDAIQILFLGNRSANDLTFDGELSDIAIYNKALSTTEITANYNAGRTGTSDMVIEP